MDQPTRQLSLSELSKILGMTPSAVSYLRSGQRFPNPTVQRAMVEHLGADWDEMNAVLVRASRGDRPAWAAYMRQLTMVPVVVEAG
jgi:transcriptional regulator with XRE-family HTH domain